MKKSIILLFLLIGTFAQAQKTTWYTDVSEAVKISEKTKKPLLLFFTGSDWCGWCIRLQKEVLQTPEFEEWAKKNVVLVELDFPRKTALSNELRMQNGQLQQFFGVRGYPTIWITKASNDKATNKISFEKMGQTGYVAGGPSAWLAGANRILGKTE